MTFVACREKAPPEGAVRVTVNYGSFRPACLRVVARDAQGQEGRTDILQNQFKDPDARKLLVAVFRKAEWGRELTLEVSSFEGSEGEACSGEPVEQLSSEPIPVPPGEFAQFEATLRAKDEDGDAFAAREEGVMGQDCNDGNAEVYPGAAERCSVAVDYDCNGFKGCQDSRCQQSACDDGNPCTMGDRCEGSGVSAQCKGQAVQCEKPAGACVLGATCSQATGQCVVARKQCAAPTNACLEAGVCNDATGNCDYAPKQASVSCDDKQTCTTGDVCNGAGVCQGTQTPCTPSSNCFVVTGGCQGAGNCTEAPDPNKVNATCALAGGTENGVCRATDGKCSRFPYAPSNFDPDAVPKASIIPLNITCDVTFNSEDLSWTPVTCVSNPPAPIGLTQGNGMVLFAVSNLNLNGELRLVGSRPVILAVYGDASLNYNILANAQGTVPGAGGSLAQACETRRGRGGVSSNSVGSGGGGAGGGTAGAAGGNGSTSGSTRGDGGSAGGNVFAPLAGGCPGGSGGGDSEGGEGGAGGGSVQISVAGTLNVSKQVSASGGGGRGGKTTAGGVVGGGGGGGSGGQVLLEAHQLNLNAFSQLTANGGGGGEGGAYRDSGNRPEGDGGDNGSTSAGSQANGGSNGSNSGGNGGKGGAQGSPGAGANGSSASSGDKGGGGGGGGASGHIRLRSVKRCSLSSSIVISPATDTQCPL
ncbi:putative metal-binding motif-containing protein [Cystobacter fuscus]|uniref:putative metal-binding motif-containing protein n=1 Tax=Cystobacter fuscus TaxID=43 RepID=UPI0037BEFF02